MDTGILYVVFNKWITDPDSGLMPYKIGITRKTVDDRYYGLGLLMPGKFETLFAYNIIDLSKAEQSIHTILTNNRVNGEWFILNQDDIDLIKNICERMNGKIVTNIIENEIKRETEIETMASSETITTDDFVNELQLLPNKKIFREKLLKFRNARWTITYKDGRIEKGIWPAKNITESSNIIGNIRSGYLRNWKEKGIVKAIFEVEEKY